MDIKWYIPYPEEEVSLCRWNGKVSTVEATVHFIVLRISF